MAAEGAFSVDLTRQCFDHSALPIEIAGTDAAMCVPYGLFESTLQLDCMG
jgi:hypothetical protein